METCTATNCDRLAAHDSDVGRLCRHHFMAWRRWGHVGSIQPESCTVEACEKPPMSGGLCPMHYKRLHLYGSTDDRQRKNARKVCSVDGCGISSVADDLCDLHYRRLRRYGTTNIPTRPSKADGRTCTICSSQLPAHHSKYCSTECREHGLFHVRKNTQRATDLRKYGITVEKYDEMLASQGGGCAICGSSTPGSGRASFAVDHDHETDAVRGLLCLSCNSGLGQFRDDPELLLRAVEYIRK